MTKFDLVLARLRQLPPEQLEEFAVKIEHLLDRDTAEQDAELARRLADPSKQYVSHEEVSKYFEKKFGR